MVTTEECISAEDATSIVKALDEFIETQTRKGGYKGQRCYKVCIRTCQSHT